MAEVEASSSATELPEISKLDAEDEPASKKIKLSKPPENPERLEQRLGGILCCAVCLDLPRAAVYQVSDRSAVLCYE